MNRDHRLYILFAFFYTAGVIAFADQPSSALDDKPSVDSAASSGVQVPAVPADTAGSTQTNYLYDLKKLIEKSKENIKEVNKKIQEQAVLKRNQKREERAREYYEKGVELTNEGKLDEAHDYFEKAIAITDHPEMAGYIKESQRRLKKQEEALHAQEREHYKQIKQDENTRREDVEQAYKEAVALYKEKKYHPAKDAFEHVDEIAPEYRATDSYLKLIDQEINLSDIQAAKQQAVEIARQQKEAEAARAKEKAAWLAQIEEKEKEQKESIDKQAADVYVEAVLLYKNKKYAEAKKKFEEVSWVIPDYKETMRYLSRIDRDAKFEEEAVAAQQQKALREQRWEEEVQNKKQEVQRLHEMEVKERQKEKDLQDQAQFLYTSAVDLFDKKDWQKACDQFISVEKVVPDYKNTHQYLEKLKSYVTVPPLPVPPPQIPEAAAVAVPSQEAVSLADQRRQVQDITALAVRSGQLYRQISDIADDSATRQTKRKMAQLDAILNDMKDDKVRTLRHMIDEETRNEQEAQKVRLEAHRAEAEKMYGRAQELFRSHDYANAKIQFAELEDLFPDYRATRRYLRRIEEYQNKIGVQETVESENAGQLSRTQQQQESLKELAQKASSINDDIIQLSRQQDYEGMKAKFTELENTIAALRALKDSMGRQKDIQQHYKQLDREATLHQNELIKVQKQQDQQTRTYGGVQSSQNSDMDQYKRREMVQEQNMLYNEGVDCYRNRKYDQAKLLFSELADQHDQRAQGWLNKVNRALTRELLRTKEGEERERTEFIAEQVKAQRELIKMQERERQHQKQLTEELERQKRQYEDELSMQMSKEQTMKAQERERELQEAKRLQLEKEIAKQQDELRFHRIAVAGQPVSASEGPVSSVSSLPPISSITSVSPVVNAGLEAQREAVRKQLENGIEIMYQEAMRVYNQGDYVAAAAKFKDVQDILPGYKNTTQYLDEARMKSSAGDPQTVIVPQASAVPASPSMSRDDSVSKALDLFDSNVK